MTHSWIKATDGNGATVRVVLFDLRKAFDLIDHRILVSKLRVYDIPEAVLSWITDFLTDRKQRVKPSALIVFPSGARFQQVSYKGPN